MVETTGGTPASAAPSTPIFTVVAASCASTAFEWYDFFIFGSLLQIISKNFFAALGPTAGLIAALALFGVGFAFRPLGALIFGRIGDRIGRKAAFFITVSMMGGGTFAIGLLPTFAQVGQLALHHPDPGLRDHARARPSAANTAARPSMSPNTRRPPGAAISPAGCSVRPPSAWSEPWR